MASDLDAHRTSQFYVLRERLDCVITLVPVHGLTLDTLREKNMPPFRRQHFQTHFFAWKLLCLDSNLTEICSQRYN